MMFAAIVFLIGFAWGGFCVARDARQTAIASDDKKMKDYHERTSRQFMYILIVGLMLLMVLIAAKS
jgi:hypothetical protein